MTDSERVRAAMDEANAARRRQAEREAVSHVVDPLRALGVAVKLIHPGDPLWQTGWIGDRVPVGLTHVDWQAADCIFDRAVEGEDARADALADALARYAPDRILVAGGNAAHPMLALIHEDAVAHIRTLAGLDPFELWLMSPDASWLIEATATRVRATDGGNVGHEHGGRHTP